MLSVEALVSTVAMCVDRMWLLSRQLSSPRMLPLTFQDQRRLPKISLVDINQHLFTVS